MFRITDIYLVIGFLLIFIVVMWFGVVYGSNSTSNMTLDCVRMFYSDTYNEGYKVESLTEFCSK
jgi:hypothetical protein